MVSIPRSTGKTLPIIFLWYLTNGLNSVCVHQFLKNFKSSNHGNHNVDNDHEGIDDYDKNSTTLSSTNPLLLHFSGWIAVVLVTTLQLFMGTFIAFVGLLGCSAFETVINSNTVNNNDKKRRPLRTAIREMRNVLSFQQLFDNNNVLNLVHASGSFFTTLGIYYGSATLVQVIKLLEPFETLVLAECVLPSWWGRAKWTNITSGIVMSMSIVVLSSVSLVFATTNNTTKKKTSEKLIHFSILASLASGCTLSLRNVLLKSTKTTTTTKAAASLPQGQDGTISPIAAPTSQELNANNKSVEKDLSKFQTQLLKFGTLSFMSGLWNSLFLAVLVTLCGDWKNLHTVNTSLKLLSFQSIVYHPLYNFFSIVTLDSTTVLTHSLLNVGKRIWSVCMSIYYFRETCTWQVVVSMTMALVGGIWYTMEKEKVKRHHPTKFQQHRDSNGSDSDRVPQLEPLLLDDKMEGHDPQGHNTMSSTATTTAIESLNTMNDKDDAKIGRHAVYAQSGSHQRRPQQPPRQEV